MIEMSDTSTEKKAGDLVSNFVEEHGWGLAAIEEWTRAEQARQAANTSGSFFCRTEGCRNIKVHYSVSSLKLCGECLRMHKEKTAASRKPYPDRYRLKLRLFGNRPADLTDPGTLHEFERRAVLAADRAEARDVREWVKAAESEYQRADKLRACYQPGNRRGYVYRMYDTDGALLYVGKTYRLKVRLEGHAKDKPWYSDVARITVKVYRNENAALAAEAWAIKREAPRYNRAHPEPFTPRAPRALLTYSGDL